MSMPTPWIEKIFQKLILTYGRDFTGRWDGVPLDEVKADWAHELRGYQNRPTAIAFALQNLPIRPPTVLEFRKICDGAPAPVAAYIPPKSHGTVTHEVQMQYLKEARELLSRWKRPVEKT